MLPSHQNVKPSQTPFLFTSFQLVFFYRSALFFVRVESRFWRRFGLELG